MLVVLYSGLRRILGDWWCWRLQVISETVGLAASGTRFSVEEFQCIRWEKQTPEYLRISHKHVDAIFTSSSFIFVVRLSLLS